MPTHPARPTRRRLMALAGAALALPGVLRAAPPTRTISGDAFGSIWRITLPDDRVLDRTGVEALLTRFDRRLSPWRADSEVSTFNRAARSAPVTAETAHVARAALTLARESAGWFDPSVGPLVQRWGFGPITGESAGGANGWTGLRAKDGHLVKERPGLTFDPCGIAKGRALDLLAARLTEAGHDSALIDLGGELAALGRHPSGRAWQVMVEDPRPGAAGAAAVLALEGLAIATSGVRAQSYDLGGRRAGHVIDPHRGVPMEGALASVSVLAGNAMQADGWATALAAAGARGPALARRHGIAALFLFDADGGLQPTVTGGFGRHLL